MPFILVFIYTSFVSVLGTALTCYDKAMARARKRRISERTLFLIALAGGALTMYMTMHLIHHKTKNRNFMIALPLMFLVHLFVFYGFYHAFV